MNTHREAGNGTSSSNSRDNGDLEKRPKNQDGTPGYFEPSRTRLAQEPRSPQPTDTNRANETSDQMNLTGQTIQINNQQYFVLGRLVCNKEELYALESDRPLKGYNGCCPICENIHIHFKDPSRGYYSSVKNINDLVQKQKLDNERLKGRRPIDQLPIMKKKLSPLEQPILGQNKGIEGDSNSCYMDTTIFCMFAYNDIFDGLLHMDTQTEELKQLQAILRDNIVHVLRDKNNGFVKRDTLFHLRAQLSEATGDPSFKEVEKDPSEFLRVFEERFRYAPIKTIAPDQPPKPDGSNITTNIIWEMFDANPHNHLSTSIASIFRNSLSEIPAKLATIPPFLILVAPRHTRSQRSYRYIIPDRQITLDHDVLQVVCVECNKTNHDREISSDFFSCSKCQQKRSTAQPSTDAIVEAYCVNCLSQLHKNISDEISSHHTQKIEFKKHKLSLFAVLCIETCHYVAFVKCQDRSVQKHGWLFFDSMSDRIYDEKNISLVAEVPNFDRWIDQAEKDSFFFNDLDDLRKQAKPTSQKFDVDGMRQLRLFRDGAFFFYEKSDANYH